ncbi:MAG TPA: glycosyl hydrolase 108 family protein [Ramlibacter sp.]|nr:glycosyl hydrolase 108 family protein [Ramlibacter sp.]
MNFEHIIDRVIAREQGFVNHPSDRGGPTCWGITQAVARENGYDGPMQDLPVSLAREIYRKRYIVRPGFDKVALVSSEIAEEMIDTGVNMHPGRAGEFLQRCLNGFNKRGSQYADVFVDGQVGKVTLDALRKYVRFRGAEGVQVMVCALNVQQGGRYFDIAENNESQEDFLYGWIRTRVLQGASA